MEPKELTPNTPTNHTAQDTIPDEARRKILGGFKDQVQHGLMNYAF
jgi:hypothetical protein